MPTITLRLSESLLCIFRDAGSPKKESCELRVAQGTTVREILADQGINPLLVPMAGWRCAGDDSKHQKRLEQDAVLDRDGILTLYGPLAGG